MMTTRTVREIVEDALSINAGEEVEGPNVDALVEQYVNEEVALIDLNFFWGPSAASMTPDQRAKAVLDSISLPSVISRLDKDQVKFEEYFRDRKLDVGRVVELMDSGHEYAEAVRIAREEFKEIDIDEDI